MAQSSLTSAHARTRSAVACLFDGGQFEAQGLWRQFFEEVLTYLSNDPRSATSLMASRRILTDLARAQTQPHQQYWTQFLSRRGLQVSANTLRDIGYFRAFFERRVYWDLPSGLHRVLNDRDRLALQNRRSRLIITDVSWSSGVHRIYLVVRGTGTRGLTLGVAKHGADLTRSFRDESTLLPDRWGFYMHSGAVYNGTTNEALSFSPDASFKGSNRAPANLELTVDCNLGRLCVEVEDQDGRRNAGAVLTFPPNQRVHVAAAIGNWGIEVELLKHL